MTQFFDSRLASFPSHASFHFIVAKRTQERSTKEKPRNNSMVKGSKLQDVRFLVLSFYY